MAEYKTDAQVNTPISTTLKATNKFPLIAKTIWATYDEMMEYVNDPLDTATPGLMLTVISDENEYNNAAYLVRKVGDGNKSGVVRRLDIESEDYTASLTSINLEVTEEDDEDTGITAGTLTQTGGTDSMIDISISDEGNLVVDYPSDLDAEFYINEEGNLIAETNDETE